MENRPLTDAQHLARRLERTLTGPMWHGPALLELLADVSVEQAAARPVPGAHSIWELVLHVAAWAEIARARLSSLPQGEPSDADDWPAPAEATAEHWQAALDRLQTAHHALAEAVASLDDAALRARVAGRDSTVRGMLHGVVEHGTYHGGQMAILKRAIGGK